MEPQPLTQQEFDRWCVDDRLFKQRMLGHIDHQYALNMAHEAKIAVLQSRQQKTIISVVVAIVSGTATVLASMFGGK